MKVGPGVVAVAGLAGMGALLSLGVNAADHYASSGLDPRTTALSSASGQVHPETSAPMPDSQTASESTRKPPTLAPAAPTVPALRPDAMSLPNEHGMPWPGDGSWADGFAPSQPAS